MATKAYSSVKEWVTAVSKKAQTQSGTGAFSEQAKKYDYSEADSLSVDIGISVETPAVSVTANVKTNSEKS